MFQQKSTETVTLTRTQLQAILELMTQIGGISQSEAWDEPKINHKKDNKITYNSENKETESEYRNNDQLFNRNNYWERERENMLERDDWYSFKDNKELHNNCPPLLMPNTNQFSNRLMSPTVSESSKAPESRAESVMTNETSNESNFRRYLRINNSEFDLNALHQKRIKALEYRRALAQQNEEKRRKKLAEEERNRIEEEMLEKRVREQRLRMKNDYEMEQKQIKEKRELAERKREAVIAAIQKTPVIKKTNFLVDKESQESSCPQPVATIRPQARTKEIFVQTDRDSFSSQNCDIGTQTDVQLLLRLLQEMSYSSKDKTKANSQPTETMSSDSTPSTRTPTPKVYKKSNDNHKSKLSGNGLSNKLVLGTNQQSKINTKSTDKYPNQKLQEMRKKLREKESLKNINKDNNDKNEDKDKGDDQIQQPFTRSLRRMSLNLSSSAKNISEYSDQKRISVDHRTKLNFLPQISARPHSRKKWYSQEAFNPSLLQ